MSADGFSESWLHAYLDGELTAADRRAVEAWLEAHPDIKARIRAYRRINDALHRSYGALLDAPLPDRMEETLARLEAPSPHRRLARLAASIALVLAIGVAGYGLGVLTAHHLPADLLPGVGPQKPARPMLVDRALGAYRVYVSEVRHPVEVDARQEAHLVKWLTKRIGEPVRAPDFRSHGFRLVGGRLLPDNGRPAALFMYEDGTGRRLTVYLRRRVDEPNTAFQYVSYEGLSAFYWIDAPLAFALTAELPRQRLLRIAKTMYEQLE